MKIKTVVFLVLVFSLSAFLFLRRGNSQQKEVKGEKNEATILFVSSTCPHCHKVENWLNENKGVLKKSQLKIKVVDKDQEAAQELMKKGEECQIDRRARGAVPLLYDRGNCVLGDEPVIDYLKQEYQ